MKAIKTSWDAVPVPSQGGMRAFVEAYPAGVVFLDEDGRVVFANAEACAMFPVSSGPPAGRIFGDLFHSSTQKAADAALRKLIQRRRPVVAGVKVELALAGEESPGMPVEVSLNLIRDGERALMFCVIEDISERIALQRKLYEQTITDPLTGLYNRRYFDQRLNQEFKRARRYRRPFAVVIIDIDGFKQANDSYGHGFGDDMLLKARDVFYNVLRNGDTVYRYGGDEFALILPESGREGSIEVAERLRNRFAQQCTIREKHIRLTLSIGIATYPEDGAEEKGLIGAADRRMYYSKENGGNLVTAHDPQDHFESDAETLLRSLSSLVHLMEQNRGFGPLKGISHSQEIRALSVEVGRRLGLEAARLYLLEQASMLHDIGTLHISNDIMRKPGKLTKREWAEIKKHTLIGEEIIGMIVTRNREELTELKNIVAQHHERFDGTGYPRGMKAEEILLEARILAATDAYSAMVTKRPYRKPYTKAGALRELRRCAGTQFDPRIVEVVCAVETL